MPASGHHSNNHLLSNDLHIYKPVASKAGLCTGGTRIWKKLVDMQTCVMHFHGVCNGNKLVKAPHKMCIRMKHIGTNAETLQQ